MSMYYDTRQEIAVPKDKTIAMEILQLINQALDEHMIPLATPLSDLGFDNIDFQQLLYNIEQKFNLELTALDEDFKNWEKPNETVETFIDRVEIEIEKQRA